MWRTNAETTHVWKKLGDGTYVYEDVHPENGPFCWKMPSKYNYSKYKNKLTTRTEEWDKNIIKGE